MNSEHIECPRCYDRWYADIEPESGQPYSCYFCCNGSVPVTQEMVDDLRADQDAERARLAARGAWILTDYDVWVSNPYYTGLPRPHPEDERYMYDEEDPR